MNHQNPYINTIQHFYPNFPIHSIQPITHGQNNDILLINNDFVFRFPKYSAGIHNLARECAILKAIHDALPLPIPHICFEHLHTHTPGQAFIGYRSIPGTPLWQETLHNLQNPHILETLAQQIAHFLQKLHTLHIELPPNHQLPIADTYDEWNNIYARIQNRCFPHMRSDARAWTTRHFENFLNDTSHFTYQPVLKHGDFGTSNILFDPTQQCITGIIDFGNSTLGDPAYDLAGLLSSYGENFLHKLIPLYPDISNMWPRITFYHGTFPLLEALFGLENNDPEAFTNGIKGYLPTTQSHKGKFTHYYL